MELSAGGALGGDSAGVVEAAVEGGAAEGGISDDIVPVLNGELVGRKGVSRSLRVRTGEAPIGTGSTTIPCWGRSKGAKRVSLKM